MNFAEKILLHILHIFILLQQRGRKGYIRAGTVGVSSTVFFIKDGCRTSHLNKTGITEDIKNCLVKFNLIFIFFYSIFQLLFVF